MWMLLIQLGPVVLLLTLGFTVGSIVERAHLKRLARREAALDHMLVTDLRSFPEGTISTYGMVVGEVVIASDYFKTFAASFKKLIGGELRTFETLMLRARREALVRLLESANNMGATAVVNVRFESSNIGSMRRKRRAAMVEMFAYGTAVQVAGQGRAEP